MSKEIIYPILPIYFTLTLGLSPIIIGLIQGLTKAFASITKFYSGFYSDQKQSRKKLIILGYLGMFGQNILLLFMNNPFGILFATFLDRFGLAIKTAPQDTTLASVSPNNKHALVIGFKKTLDKLGASIGIIIAAFLLFSVNFKSIFLIASIPAFFSVILVFLIKQRRLRKIVKISLKDFNSNVQLYFGLVFLSTIGNSTKVFLLLRVAHMGFSSQEVIFLYLVTTLTTCLVSIPIGNLVDKINAKNKLIATAYLIFGLAYFILFATNQDFLIIFAFILHGIFIALISISAKAFILDNINPKMIATGIGINECLVGLGSLPATIIASSLWSIFSPDISFLFSAIIAFLSSFIAFKYLKNNHLS